MLPGPAPSEEWGYGEIPHRLYLIPDNWGLTKLAIGSQLGVSNCLSIAKERGNPGSSTGCTNTLCSNLRT